MIAATRILKVRTPDGDLDVPVEIQVPVLDGAAWTCRFSIGWPDGKAEGYAKAMDGVQALEHALQHVGMLLYVSRHHEARTLDFDIPGDGYGFPLPRGSRGLAIGLDKNM